MANDENTTTAEPGVDHAKQCAWARYWSIVRTGNRPTEAEGADLDRIRPALGISDEAYIEHARAVARIIDMRDCLATETGEAMRAAIQDTLRQLREKYPNLFERE